MRQTQIQFTFHSRFRLNFNLFDCSKFRLMAPDRFGSKFTSFPGEHVCNSQQTGKLAACIGLPADKIAAAFKAAGPYFHSNFFLTLAEMRNGERRLCQP